MTYYLHCIDWERKSQLVQRHTSTMGRGGSCCKALTLLKVTQSPSSKAHKNHTNHRTHSEVQGRPAQPTCSAAPSLSMAVHILWQHLACFSSILSQSSTLRLRPSALHTLPGMSNLHGCSEQQAGLLRPKALTFHTWSLAVSICSCTSP